MKIKRREIHYKHDVKVYVPVFQRDFDSEGNLLPSPETYYSLEDATQDEQMAWSFNPVYVFELNGHFDYKTKPIEIEEED